MTNVQKFDAILPFGVRTSMKPNPDGSLTIYIQSESQGNAKEANWLPAPKTGPFWLTLRIYSPMEEVIKGAWVPPAIVRQK
jgi:hypothetical protein